jgi:AAA-like domain
MSGYRVDYVEDGVLVSGEGPWVGLRLPNHSDEGLSDEQRLARLAQETRLLVGLAGFECHLLVVPRTYAVSRWAEVLDRATPDPAPGWRSYLEQVAEHLRGQRFRQREVYLLVRLQDRRRRGWLRSLLSAPERITGLEDPRPRESVLAALRREVDLVRRRVVAASPGARLATASELRWLVQRTLWRGLAEDAEVLDPPRRPAWGGETLALLEGLVRNGYRALEVGDETTGTGQVAALAVAHMPESLEYPGGAEWLHRYDLLDCPIEASVRFRVVPPRQAAGDVNRHVAAVVDQVDHILGTSADLPLDVLESYEGARELERSVLKGQQPLIYCWPRLLVSAPSRDELVERVTDLVENYRDLGIELVRPSGDQLSLFLEAMPGDRVRVAAYEQRMAPVTLAGAMWGASSEVGDGMGSPAFGHTTGVTRSLVALDALGAADEEAGMRPTGTSLTGEPGGGKTNAALLTDYVARLRGYWVCRLDPKKEATGLAGLPGLGRVQVIELDESYEGLLDPYRIERDPEAAALMATDWILGLLGRIQGPPAEGHVITAAAAEAAAGDPPSLLGVLDRLADSPGEDARQAAAALRAMARLPLARVIFAEREVARLSLADALTVIQFRSLSLPDAGTRPEEYSISERLSVVLMRAVTALAGTLMTAGPLEQPKLLDIDEAWALTRSSDGQRLVERVARLGRYFNTALQLVSQNAQDLMDERVTNCLAVRLGFRSRDEGELRALCQLLDVEATPELMQQIANFAPGECLMRDRQGRVGRVQVDLVPEVLREAFDTRPQAAASREEVMTR